MFACSLFVVRCSLAFVDRRSLFGVCLQLLVVGCSLLLLLLLFVVRCLVFVDRRGLFVVGCRWLRYALFVVCCELLAVRLRCSLVRCALLVVCYLFVGCSLLGVCCLFGVRRLLYDV